MGEKMEGKETPKNTQPPSGGGGNRTLFHYFTAKGASKSEVTQIEEEKSEEPEVVSLDEEKNNFLSKKRKKTQSEDDSEEARDAVLKATKKLKRSKSRADKKSNFPKRKVKQPVTVSNDEIDDEQVEKSENAKKATPPEKSKKKVKKMVIGSDDSEEDNEKKVDAAVIKQDEVDEIDSTKEVSVEINEKVEDVIAEELVTDDCKSAVEGKEKPLVNGDKVKHNGLEKDNEEG